MTKKQKIVLSYLQGRSLPELRGKKPEDLIPTFDEIKSFIIGLDAASLRKYMHDSPYAATFSERTSKALRDEAEAFLQEHGQVAPQMKSSRIGGTILEDVKPHEVGR